MRRLSTHSPTMQHETRPNRKKRPKVATHRRGCALTCAREKSQRQRLHNTLKMSHGRILLISLLIGRVLFVFFSFFLRCLWHKLASLSLFLPSLSALFSLLSSVLSLCRQQRTQGGGAESTHHLLPEGYIRFLICCTLCLSVCLYDGVWDRKTTKMRTQSS